MRRFVRVALALSAALALAVVAALAIMARQDAAHARFYNTGKTINGFLSEYGRALARALDRDGGSHAAAEGVDADALNALLAFYSDRYAVAGRGDWALGEPAMIGGAVVRQARLANRRDYGRVDLADAFSAYAASVANVGGLRFKIDLIESVGEDHRSATLTVKYVMDGVDGDGRLFQDRYFYRWRLVKEGQSDAYGWRILGDELVEGVRVAGDGAVFEAMDLAAAGVDYAHRRDPKLDIKSGKLKFGVVGHSQGGISAADYDGDGLPDLFFGDGVRCRLYRNLGADAGGSPRFVDVTAKTGLDGVDQANAGLFADIDNDGDQDLLITRYLAPNRLYRNNGAGFFEEVSAQMGVDAVTASSSAVFFDYDRDGWLDLYIGAFGDAFKRIPRLPFFARNGEPNRLYRNDRGQRFVDVSEEAGVADTGWTLAVTAGDYNGDGWSDLLLANDFGRKCLYRNNGDGTFSEVAKQAGVLDFSGGMGALFADFNDDGLQDLYTSNIKSNQRWFGEDQTVAQYIRNVMRTAWIWRDFSEYRALYGLVGSAWPELGKQVGEGNSFFLNNGDETFEELKDSHANQAGWGWSVVAFDFDNDADLDIYAANGWISNTPETDL